MTWTSDAKAPVSRPGSCQALPAREGGVPHELAKTLAEPTTGSDSPCHAMPTASLPPLQARAAGWGGKTWHSRGGQGHYSLLTRDPPDGPGRGCHA